MIDIREHITLIESLNLFMLDEAIGLKNLVKTFGEKVAARYATQSDHTPAEVQAAIAAQPGASDGEKVIAYLMSMDPNPRQAYTVWLVTRYLNGDYFIEDAPQIREHLTVFDRVKQRLANKDILRYSTGDLFDAIRPYLEANAPKSNASAERELAQKMHDPKQVRILYNDADLKVLVPLTKAASCYFGRSTKWCTAATSNNHHDHYSQQGPLIVILFKKENRRYQYHYESNQFKDERDVEIDRGELLRAHPILMQIIGEDKFIRDVENIGLSMFSPEALARAPVRNLARAVHGYADFKLLPPDMQNDPRIVRDIIRHDPGVLRDLPEELYRDMLPELVEQSFDVFPNLPEHLQDEYASVVLPRAERWRWESLERYLPKRFWTPEIEETYWNSRLRDDRQLHLKDVPERYRDDSTLVAVLLARFPEDIPAFHDVLTPDAVGKIVQKNEDALGYIPENYLTQEVVNDYYQKHFGALDQKPHRSRYDYTGYGRDKKTAVLRKFPERFWTAPMVMTMADNKLLGFDDLPEKFRHDGKLVGEMIKGDANLLRTIPHRYLTPEILTDVLDFGNIDKVDPAVVPDEVMVNVVRTKGTMRDYLYRKTPEALKTPAVMRAFMAGNVVPVKEMPDDLIDEKAIFQRVMHHADEYPDIPERFLTERFVFALVRANHRVAAFVDPSLRTERVLTAFLSARSYGYGNDHIKAVETFTSFPKTAWSPRVLALALRHGFLKPDPALIPEGMLTRAVAAMLAARDPANLDHLPPDLLDEAVLVKAIEQGRPEIVDHLTPEQVTEPVAYAYVKHFAPYDYQHNVIRRLPRDHWSERVYYEAVGRFLTLKDVPAKFRKPGVIEQAFMRDPISNLPLLKDAAGWLNKNPQPWMNGKDWRVKAEAGGVIFVKKQGFVNVADLDRQDLPSGGFVATIKSGPVNRRAYVFDKAGKFLVRMFTEKDKVWIPEWQSVQKQQRRYVMEAANLLFQRFDPGDLNHLDIFDNRREFVPVEQAQRQKIGGLDYTRTEHFGSDLYTVWHGKKQALRLHLTTSNAAFGRSTPTVDVDVFDPAYLLPRAADVLALLKMKHLPTNGGYRLEKIGIVVPKGGDYELIAEKKLGEVGDLSVWTNDAGTRLCLAGPQGVMARGAIRKNGSIGNINIDYHYRHGEDEAKTRQSIEDAFKKMEEVLMKQRAAKR